MLQQEQKPVPDIAAITTHLRHITRRWGELGQPVCLELVFLSAEDHAKVKNVARFSVDDTGIALAADHVESMNRYGVNAYAVVNPIDATRPLVPESRASAPDIVASFFHWADADSAQAAENIKNFVGPKCTFFVLTGTQPSLRPHVYWELDEPTRNLTAWNATQRAIAATLKTDPTVIDPPRIMRIAGSVNWPKPQKVAKGYIPEVTTLRIYSADERPPVESERMARAFAVSVTAPPQAPGGFQIDTGEHHGKKAEEYADILRRARTDGEKHGGVRDLAASLAGSGVPRHLAEAIVREACPVWDDGVVNLIDTAYAKFWKPKETFTPNFDHAPAPTPSDPAPQAASWRVQTAAAFTSDFVAPEYIIDGIVQRGRIYTLTAPTGSGKTAAMLYASVAIATGMQFCCNEVERGDVLFMAGENPDDVRARVIATLEFYGIDPNACRLHFIAGTFSIRADMEKLRQEAAALPDLKLVVIDTFAAYFDGDDENSNAQALDFARLVRRIAAFPAKPAVIMPAHPVKNATRGNLTPKGGSSLLNEVDGNLTLWNDGGILSMHWQGKFRGAEFEPLSMELQKYESSLICDNQGRIIPTILAKPILVTRAIQIARDNLKLEDKLLFSIRDFPAISLEQRGTDAGGVHKQKVARTLMKMAEQKLVRRFRTNWELTKEGERAIEIIENGDGFVPEIDG